MPRGGGSPIRRRPVTVACHYGWYSRLPGTQTVGCTGGDYFSWDPEVETLFNEQKNDVGISVDAAELDATAGQLERGGGQFCDEMGVTSLVEPRTLSSAIDQ